MWRRANIARSFIPLVFKFRLTNEPQQLPEGIILQQLWCRQWIGESRASYGQVMQITSAETQGLNRKRLKHAQTPEQCHTDQTPALLGLKKSWRKLQRPRGRSKMDREQIATWKTLPGEVLLLKGWEPWLPVTDYWVFNILSLKNSVRIALWWEDQQFGHFLSPSRAFSHSSIFW